MEREIIILGSADQRKCLWVFLLFKRSKLFFVCQSTIADDGWLLLKIGTSYVCCTLSLIMVTLGIRNNELKYNQHFLAKLTRGKGVLIYTMHSAYTNALHYCFASEGKGDCNLCFDRPTVQLLKSFF
jgi:hypothetical protein